MAKENTPSKTCLVCGIQKPLSAFLQISGPEGNTYGNACATCRGSGLGRKITIPQQNNDEDGASSSGLRIDSKTKIQMDLEKNEASERLREVNIQEEKKNQAITEEKLDRENIKKESEEKHRDFIEAKKTDRFLNYQNNKFANQEQTHTKQEQEILEKKSSIDQQSINEAQRNNTNQQEQSRQQDLDSKEKNRYQTNLNQKTIRTKTNKTQEDKYRNTQMESKKRGSFLNYQHKNLTEKKQQQTKTENQRVEFKKVRELFKKRIALSIYKKQAELASNTEKKDPLIDYISENWEEPGPPKTPGSRNR